MQYQDRITELRAVLPDILSCTDLKKESDTSYCGPCAICGGDDRFVYKTDSGKCWCRQCHDKPMDVIDFHCWLHNKTIPDLMREYNINGPAMPTVKTTHEPKATSEPSKKPENTDINNEQTLRESAPDVNSEIQAKWNEILTTNTNEKPVFDLFGRRGLSDAVIQALYDAGKARFKNYARTVSVAVPYSTLQRETLAIQCLTVDGQPYPFTVENGRPANKVMMKGSAISKDCYFFCGADINTAKYLIIAESVVNALTAVECCPDACCIALGGSTFTSKVGALKPYIEQVERVTVLVDNDHASKKMLRAIWDILGTRVWAIRWDDGAPKGYDINDLLMAGQRDRVIDMIRSAEQVWYAQETPANTQQTVKRDDWMFAGERFPKTQFPWEVLPPEIAGSFRQLARSCAASPTHLPGIAFGILAAVLGRHIEVNVKSSWSEPLIFWMLALLPSGQGKSPAQHALSGPIYVEQERLDTAHKQALTAWKALPADEQAQNPKPEPLGGIFTSDMTIEGLRHDQRACGGILISNDEASSFFEGQNQYKKSGKGTDRESWLKLYDGNPARIVRTSGAVFLKGARASIIGGTQPGVFWRIFRTDSNGDDIFLVDGTLFRFLMTWEGDKFYPMTMESWDDSNRAVWDNLIHNALSFCQAHTGVTIDGDEEVLTHSLWLSEATLEMFVDWSNELKGITSRLPEQVRGYIPKLIGWAVRLTGIIKCLESFLAGTKVPQVIAPDDLKKGIRLAEFYMGHNVDVIQAIVTSVGPVKETYTEQELHLARTLQSIKGDVDNGKLAISYILEKYTATATDDIKFKGKNSNPFRGFIESCGLTVPDKKATANGYKNYKCLVWDDKTDKYLEKMATFSKNSTTIDNKGCGGVEDGNQNSTNSTTGEQKVEFVEKWKVNSTAENPVITGVVEKVEFVEKISGVESDEVTI